MWHFVRSKLNSVFASKTFFSIRLMVASEIVILATWSEKVVYLFNSMI